MAAVLLAYLTTVSCGGGGGGPPSAPAPVAPPPATTVVYQGNFQLAPSASAMGEFQCPGAGTLTVVVDWTLTSNNVVVAVTTSACTSLAGALSGGCNNLAPPAAA